jgi:mannan endo-1,4-beta-mannosidase
VRRDRELRLGRQARRGRQLGREVTRRQALSLGGLAAAGALLAACSGGAGGSGAVPELRRRAKIGINHPFATLLARESQLGYRFPIVGGLYYTFDTVWSQHEAARAPARGRELLVCWMPEKSNDVVTMTAIADGSHDAHVDQMLAGMRAFPGPVVVRWGHEANGNWYPWSAANTGGRASHSSPQDYVAAWRHIVARERALPGASNISWFWCANANDVPSAGGKAYSLEQYWPGEQWVDFIGCDGYNEPHSWTSFDSVFAKPYRRITALSAKPFWIGEVGCHEPLPGQSGTKSGWIADMLKSRRFPAMQALCYFDYDARPSGRADWRLDSTAGTFDAVRSVFASVPTQAPR